MRSTIIRLCFAIALVFAQEQALLHALGHDFERIHRSSQDVDHEESACAKCLALAGLGHANASTAIGILPVAYAAPLAVRAIDVGATPVFVGVYQSRAPPVFS